MYKLEFWEDNCYHLALKLKSWFCEVLTNYSLLRRFPTVARRFLILLLPLLTQAATVASAEPEGIMRLEEFIDQEPRIWSRVVDAIEGYEIAQSAFIRPPFSLSGSKSVDELRTRIEALPGICDTLKAANFYYNNGRGHHERYALSTQGGTDCQVVMERLYDETIYHTLITSRKEVTALRPGRKYRALLRLTRDGKLVEVWVYERVGWLGRLLIQSPEGLHGYQPSIVIHLPAGLVRLNEYEVEFRFGQPNQQ